MSARVIQDDGGDTLADASGQSLEDSVKLQRLEINLQKAKEMNEVGNEDAKDAGTGASTKTNEAKTPKRQKTNSSKDAKHSEVVYAPEFDEVTTDKDHLANLRGEGRYFGVVDTDAVQPVCSNCHRRGHKRSQCKVVVCHACGKVDDHYETQCPISMVCSNCGERGHFRNNCPSKRKQTYCVECDSRNHSSDRCPTIWRSYVLKKDRSNKIAFPTNKIFCYNCAEKGHYGDDCPEMRISKTPNINGSAFSGVNLPKELIDQYNDTLDQESGNSKKRKFDTFSTNYNYAPPAYQKSNNYNNNYNKNNHNNNYNNSNNNSNNRNYYRNNNNNTNSYNQSNRNYNNDNNNNNNYNNNRNYNNNSNNNSYNNNNTNRNRNYNNPNIPNGPSKMGFIPLRTNSQNQRRNQNYYGNKSNTDNSRSAYLNNNRGGQNYRKRY